VCTVTPATRAAIVVSGHGTASGSAGFSGLRAAITTPVRRRVAGVRAGSAVSSEQIAWASSASASASRHRGHDREVTS
jgi:hypothetical protein